MTISVTQALAELKLLRRRIQSATQSSEFIVLRHKRDVLVPADFATSARAAYQSYVDLLKRYKAIKSAIVLSNAATTVTIAGVAYTVADAVERKRAIEFEKEMLVTLDVKVLIARMTQSIEDFETKVDWVLSESNGRTMISV